MSNHNSRKRRTHLPSSSVELLQHHEREHAKVCPTGHPIERPCPCGAILVVICSACHKPITIWQRELGVNCEHFDEAQRWIAALGMAVR